MRKIIILMMMAGLVSMSACASNEANKESVENDAEMANEKAEAAVDDAQANAEEAEAEASDAAAQAEADAAEAKAEAEEAMADAEGSSESAMAAEAADDSADGSGDKVFVCKNGEEVRTISLIYNDEGSEKICQVDYEKSSGVQTLWTAIIDKDYCREKAEEFVQKQEGWGWECTEQ